MARTQEIAGSSPASSTSRIPVTMRNSCLSGSIRSRRRAMSSAPSLARSSLSAASPAYEKPHYQAVSPIGAAQSEGRTRTPSRSARVRVNGQARLPRRAPQFSPGRYAGGCAAAAFRPLRRLDMTLKTAPCRALQHSLTGRFECSWQAIAKAEPYERNAERLISTPMLCLAWRRGCSSSL